MSPKAPEPLPHRFPFRLVEQADEGGPERVAIVLATANGAATGVEAWPSTLVAEALAQAILVVARPVGRGTLRLVGLDGVAVFQPLTPGDRLEVEVEYESRDALFGRILRVVAAGPARVAPRCPIVMRCGGCPWQAISYDAQLGLKRARLETALHGAPALRAVPVAPV